MDAAEAQLRLALKHSRLSLVVALGFALFVLSPLHRLAARLLARRLLDAARAGRLLLAVLAAAAAVAAACAARATLPVACALFMASVCIELTGCTFCGCLRLLVAHHLLLEDAPHQSLLVGLAAAISHARRASTHLRAAPLAAAASLAALVAAPRAPGEDAGLAAVWLGLELALATLATLGAAVGGLLRRKGFG